MLGWQLFERLSTGALPASVLNGYFQSYGLQDLARKLRSAIALCGHVCFLVFPALLPATAVVAWKKRHTRDTQFLAAWAVLFFGGALAVFFAGSARYLLPMVAPLALLASRLRPKWLAAGAAAQLALGLALAWVNYQHWDGYRRFAASLRSQAAQHRVWIDGEWGLRYYLEAEGGLPLRKGQLMRPGDLVVTSELANAVQFTQPVAPFTGIDIHSSLPLRLIGLDSRSGYSTAAKGLLPFGISHGPIDRVRAEIVMERHPQRLYLRMDAPEAREQIVSGIYGLEANAWRWMSGSGIILLKSPPVSAPLRVAFVIPGASPTRSLRLLLDGKPVAEQEYPGPGSYILETPAQLPGGPTATLELIADKTFSVASDRRVLSVILSGAGFQPVR